MIKRKIMYKNIEKRETLRNIKKYKETKIKREKKRQRETKSESYCILII